MAETAKSPAEGPNSPQGSPAAKRDGSSATSAAAPGEGEMTAERPIALPTKAVPVERAVHAQPPTITQSMAAAAAAEGAPTDATSPPKAVTDPKPTPGSTGMGMWEVHPGDPRLEWPTNLEEKTLSSGGTAVVFRSVSVAHC